MLGALIRKTVGQQELPPPSFYTHSILINPDCYSAEVTNAEKGTNTDVRHEVKAEADVKQEGGKPVLRQASGFSDSSGIPVGAKDEVMADAGTKGATSGL